MYLSARNCGTVIHRLALVIFDSRSTLWPESPRFFFFFLMLLTERLKIIYTRVLNSSVILIYMCLCYNAKRIWNNNNKIFFYHNGTINYVYTVFMSMILKRSIRFSCNHYAWILFIFFFWWKKKTGTKCRHEFGFHRISVYRPCERYFRCKFIHNIGRYIREMKISTQWFCLDREKIVFFHFPLFLPAHEFSILIHILFSLKNL